MIFRAVKKNPFPPLPPNSWWFLPKIWIFSSKITKIWRTLFEYRAEIAILKFWLSKLLLLQKRIRIPNFSPWFECLWIKYNKKGLLVHGGTIKWQKMLIFWPKIWISGAWNQVNVNRNLIPSRVIVTIFFLLVFFASNVLYGWPWVIDMDQLLGLTL